MPVVAKQGPPRAGGARYAGSSGAQRGAFRSSKRRVTAASTSIPVPQTSPSPCAKWTSPTEKSAPGTCTGRSNVEPAVSRRMSRLPPFSRGGIVRRPPAAGSG
jgi:hypothetical protein